jgi:hypothetical protein
MDLPYDHWLVIAFAVDDHIAQLKKQQIRRGGRTGRR